MRLLLDTHALIWWMEGGAAFTRGDPHRNPQPVLFAATASGNRNPMPVWKMLW